jgi:hypothetical protein
MVLQSHGVRDDDGGGDGLAVYNKMVLINISAVVYTVYSYSD